MNLEIKAKLNIFEMLFLLNKTLLNEANIALSNFIENEMFEDAEKISVIIKNIQVTNIHLENITKSKQKEYRRNKINEVFNQ